MNKNVLQKELSEQIKRLGLDQQQKVLEYARALVHDKKGGVSGESLLKIFRYHIAE